MRIHVSEECYTFLQIMPEKYNLTKRGEIEIKVSIETLSSAMKQVSFASYLIILLKIVIVSLQLRTTTQRQVFNPYFLASKYYVV